MRTNVAETSLRAHDHLVDTGAMSGQKGLVMAVIKPGKDYSINEISELTRLPINAASGRVSDLVRKDKLLEYGPQRACRVTGSTITPVRLPIAGQLPLIQ